MYPEAAKNVTSAVFSWRNYAIIKSLFICLLLFNLQRIGALGYLLWKKRRPVAKNETGDTLEGIPVVELLDHLFEFESFKREDIEKKFWMSRNRYSRLALKLDEIGVLLHGKNNARILNPEYSRSDVAAILSSADNARDLKAVFRQVGPGSFTKEPSRTSIVEKVTAALGAPLPRRFELHKL